MLYFTMEHFKIVFTTSANFVRGYYYHTDRRISDQNGRRTFRAGQ